MFNSDTLVTKAPTARSTDGFVIQLSQRSLTGGDYWHKTIYIWLGFPTRDLPLYLVGHFYITEMLKINLDVDREVCLWTNCHIFVVDPVANDYGSLLLKFCYLGYNPRKNINQKNICWLKLYNVLQRGLGNAVLALFGNFLVIYRMSSKIVR